MADTIRTQTELLQIFHDNNRGEISAQDLRDLTVTTLTGLALKAKDTIAVSYGRSASGTILASARRNAVRPLPSLLLPTIVSTSIRPLWMSADGTKFWGKGITGTPARNLYESTDDGATWTQIATFATDSTTA